MWFKRKTGAEARIPENWYQSWWGPGCLNLPWFPLAMATPLETAEVISASEFLEIQSQAQWFAQPFDHWIVLIELKIPACFCFLIAMKNMGKNNREQNPANGFPHNAHFIALSCAAVYRESATSLLWQTVMAVVLPTFPQAHVSRLLVLMTSPSPSRFSTLLTDCLVTRLSEDSHGKLKSLIHFSLASCATGNL